MEKIKRFASKRKLVLAPVVGLVALALAGCSAHGGGFIDGKNADKATFGFTWKTNPDILRGSWHDGYVKFRLDRNLFVTSTNDSCLAGVGHYVSTSTDKYYRGSGKLYLKVCDYGEPGATEGDTISVHVLTGPFDYYSNYGTLQGGNLQVSTDN